MWCALLFINRLLQTLVLRYTKGDGKSWIWSVTSTISDRKFKTAAKALGKKIIVQKSIFKSQQKSSLFSLFSSFLASCKHTKNKQISQKFKRLGFFLFAFKILVYRNRRAKGKSLVQRQAVGLRDKINFGNKKVSFTANTECRELHISHPYPKQHLLFERKV